jgi:micrococcal nuclease
MITVTAAIISLSNKILTAKGFHFLVFPLLFLFLFTYPFPVFSTDSVTGKVVDVADGDTITILTTQNQHIKIRLSSIDCPESSQPFGNKAKQFTFAMAFGKNVTIHPETTDKYGRTVAMVLVNGLNLNKEIVANGYGGFTGSTAHRASVMSG